VFVSSIKVNGERTGERSFREGDAPHPEDAYGQSKLEAEEALQQIGARTGLEQVVVRPPLVHGPGVRGNLLRLMGLIARGIPLPFGMIHNRRSLLGVENLADLLLVAATHPAAAGEILLAADDPPLSTPDLVRRLARGLGVRARLWPAPAGLLRGMARLPKIGPALARLTQSLEVDGSRARQVLGWAPSVGLDEGLEAMTAWYRARSVVR
jgi:nucleoside-diphosphate-sugar epimerase